jgi:predicted double-glycine peptidase
MGKTRLAVIPKGAIKVPVLNVRQQTRFSCGAAVLHTVCTYWGIESDNEFDYIEALESDPQMGTPPDRIITFARQRGLKAKEQHDMTIADLKYNLDRGRPVIVLIQAWGDKKEYKSLNRHGHYVIVIGYDSRKIYIEDPVLEGIRGCLTNKQFEERWHDRDGDGNYYTKYGISVWRKGKPSYLTKAIEVP